MTVAVFANFRIDTKERLQRMKDSFQSFYSKKINQWIINFRGQYKDSALNYLSKELGHKLMPSKLNSKYGWFFDSRTIFKKIKCDYIFFWIEDHICLCGKNKFNKIIKEIYINNVEYIGYSWWGNGLFLDEFKNIKKKEDKNIFFLNYNKSSDIQRQTNASNIIGSKAYIISCCGIFKKNFFKRILYSNRPYLRRWSKYTPFDFEKTPNDTWILPLKLGIPKFEMFSSIDDDGKYSGSSLISRNLYPKRISRFRLNKRENQKLNANFQIFKKIVKKILFFSWLQNLIKRISYHF